jgi:hypothetical protein
MFSHDAPPRAEKFRLVDDLDAQLLGFFQFRAGFRSGDDQVGLLAHRARALATQ